MRLLGLLLGMVMAAASAAPAQTVDDLLTAVRNQPRTVTITESFDGARYDLKITNLCDEGSLNRLASAYVSSGGFLDPNRAIAMTVTLKFPGANPAIKDVTVPLIAMADFGDKGTENCDSLLVSDIPRNQRVIARFDVATKEFYVISDKTALVTAFVQLSSALSSVKGLSLTSPWGAAATTAFGLIAQNAKPITDLTAAANTLLAQLDVGKSPRPQLRPLERDKARLTYVSGRRDVFSLAKENRVSRMLLPQTANTSWQSVPDDFARPYGQLEVKLISVESSHAPWTSSEAEFCADLDRQLVLQTQGDQVAVAIGKAYHMYMRPDDYQELKLSCLSPSQVALLRGLKYRQPFANAYSLKYVGNPKPKTAPQVTVATRQN